MLNTKQRAQLRALANPLAVTLIIGKEGVTEAVERELDALLESHELVKARCSRARCSRRARYPRRSARRPARMPYSASARSSLSTVSRATRTSARSFL
ncbi:MAG: YhbY family RNA-binding protein [Butyricicoccaceae bacterium]